MENIAHALCGLRVADLGFRERVGPRAPLIGILAANLPDADLLLLLHGRDTYTWWHRGLTHSFLGWPALAVGAAAVSRRLTGKGTYRDHLALWAAGLLSHALLDWPTTWGTLLFYPLTELRFALDWVFIVDPMFWLLLGLLPWLLRRSRGREGAARAGLVALTGWVLFCGMMREQAGSQAEKGTEVFPAALAPWRWTGVREADTLTRSWLTPWSADPAGTFPVPRGPEVDRIRQSRAGDRYFWMSRAPALRALERDPDGTVRVTLSDLAYTSVWFPDDFRFSTTFTLDGEGAVVAVDR